MPSARGISGSISNVLGGEADSAGEKAGTTIEVKIMGALAWWIGTALKMLIMEGAALEQSRRYRNAETKTAPERSSSMQ